MNTLEKRRYNILNINWKVRLKHKQFWIAIISALLLLSNQIAGLFNFDLTPFSNQILQIAETVLMILVLLGVVIDPTTNGIQDSKRALTYNKPKKD